MAKFINFTVLYYIQYWVKREIRGEGVVWVRGYQRWRGGVGEGLSSVNHKISGYGSVRLRWLSEFWRGKERMRRRGEGGGCWVLRGPSKCVTTHFLVMIKGVGGRELLWIKGRGITRYELIRERKREREIERGRTR